MSTKLQGLLTYYKLNNFTGKIVNWRINKLLLPHNLYSGAKHIPLSSQRPFHFHCSIGALFHSDLKKSILRLGLYNNFKHERILDVAHAFFLSIFRCSSGLYPRCTFFRLFCHFPCSLVLLDCRSKITF